MTDTFFSIVIPTYNRAHLIRETIDSVLAQTYPHFEILVIDDCSRDNTEAILQPLIDKKQIRYVRNAQNLERSYSRNVGFKLATGDFVTMLDSDDFMYKDCLLDAVKFIQQQSNIKVFHNKIEIVDNNCKTLYKIPYMSLHNQYKAICSGNFMSVQGTFMHRDIYDKFIFSLDPKMIGSEDYEFWFQILARYNVGRINKINCGVREHPERSVNTGGYNELRYQCNKIIETIKNDSLLNEKFGPYIGRLKASYELQEITVNYSNYPFTKKIKMIVMAAKNDFTIIFTRRYLAVLINIFIKG